VPALEKEPEAPGEVEGTPDEITDRTMMIKGQ